ncbi:4-hydroxybenzoate 3-monooxygenase [Arthrobacter castelli]|uniref:4-hydroxybenzoate 3-monooxygenase n=1 Tax=Arthrobacter castelli TaxID=271431 RepID=UPI0004240627|nr:4-hydroxybenzoate 3-monooxygenase [Arthrobacter castelli]
MERRIVKTQVGIVGAGPAGLMLSHLLYTSGIDSTVVESRSHETIRTTQRAGILEHGSVNMLVDSGASDRVLREGHRHDGIELRFDGRNHRIDFLDLVGESVWLYPQNEVFTDLAEARHRTGGDVRYSSSDSSVLDLETDTPKIHFTDVDGQPWEVHCDVVVGSDGSGGICKKSIPAEHRKDYFIQYPFAWFGILAEAPPSAPELIYAHSDRGFALISQRTDKIQRMYFQCDPNEDASTWTEEMIWEELQSRMGGQDGFHLKTGRIFEQMVLPFRSYVCEPMRYGNLFLAGDASHTVPPTGAKGLNLALADVKVLHEGLDSYFNSKNSELLDAYSDRALQRVWKAQNFSYWMTSMLHQHPDGSEFEKKRQLGELSSVVSSRAGSSYLAEAYTGWPLK